jgi:hypothetical protein
MARLRLLSGATMKRALVWAAAAFVLAGCGPQPQGGSSTAPRIFDTQRNALDKAKTVNDSVTQGAEALRAQEEAQAK